MGCSGSKVSAPPSAAPAAKVEAKAASTAVADQPADAAEVVEDKAQELVSELLKPQDQQSKAEDTETVTTLPKEDSPLFGREVKVEGEAAAGPCTCSFW